jgi:preprotein translocase subunit SecD
MDRRAFVTGSLMFLARLEAQQAPTADVELMLFETAESVAPTTSNTYDRFVLPSGKEIYIAQAPALIFHTADIASVVIKRQRPTRTPGQRHTAIISLQPDAGAQLEEFSQSNVGKRVDIRLNGERLSTPLIVAPISLGRVTLDVGPSRERINKLFGPLGAKLSWAPEGS